MKKSSQFFLFSLALACWFVSCKDQKKICNFVVNKYISCAKEAYKRAQNDKRSEHNQDLLKTLGKKIHSKAWKKRYLTICQEKPVTSKEYKCYQQATCKNLSKCPIKS